MSISITFHPEHSMYPLIHATFNWIERTKAAIDDASDAEAVYRKAADESDNQEDFEIFSGLAIGESQFQYTLWHELNANLQGSAFEKHGRAIVATYPEPTALNRQWLIEAKALAKAHRERKAASWWASECSLARRVHLAA